MSFAIEKEAWALIASDTVELTDADKLILLRLSFWANRDRECWHGTEALAKGICHRSTAISCLQKLARLGVLTKRPRQQAEGRGRANDVIVVDPTAAKSDAAKSSADQSRNEAAAMSESDPQQSRNGGGGTNKGTGKELEKELEKREEAAIGKRRRNLALPSVGRLKVTEDELHLAAAALAQFNLRNGSRLRLLGRANGATESLKRIVERLRENEEITAEELREIVNRSFQNPYWSGPAKVGNIFGPKAFQGAIVNDGVARSSRTVRRDIDRRPEERRRRGPDW